MAAIEWRKVSDRKYVDTLNRFTILSSGGPWDLWQWCDGSTAPRLYCGTCRTVTAAKLRADRIANPAPASAGYRISGKPDRPVVVPLDGEGGWKGRAARLAEAMNGRWSHRAGGYVLTSERRRQLFAALYAAGWDGGWNGGLVQPDGENWPHNVDGPRYTTRVGKWPSLESVGEVAA
jgi:hypothetical protein